MKTMELAPDQAIALNDYPVHSYGILMKYFEECKLGQELPLVPVIKKQEARKYLEDNLLKEFERFEQQNPSAEYFVLDGNHRTTALTFSGRKIRAAVLKTDSDIEEARILVSAGKILQSEILCHSLEENCRILNLHFKEKPYFLTVKQKTEKISQEKKVPLEIASVF